MKVLAGALASQGERFPFPFGLPANIHDGYLVELLAAPRVGKSIVALNWAIHVAKDGAPVLIHSVDTDYGTQATRAAAILSGEPQAEIERRRDYWAGWLQGQDLPIRWSTAALHDGSFMELVEAEAEYLGEYPRMIVVDVVMDLMRGEENAGNVRRVFRSLHSVGRRTGAVVLALHHVKRGDAASGSTFVRMEDGLYGGEGIAEIVLTMWRAGTDKLAMYLAKNRQGADGQTQLLACDYARAKVAVA